MSAPLSRVLLVDDDDADNYLHKRVLSRSGAVDAITVARNGREALDYLTTAEAGQYPQPELVLLDINMPGMNGWEFLERYAKLPESQTACMVVVMLTTSLNPDDAARAERLSHVVRRFINKPLTEALLEEILAEFYPNGGRGDQSSLAV